MEYTQIILIHPNGPSPVSVNNLDSLPQTYVLFGREGEPVKTILVSPDIRANITLLAAMMEIALVKIIKEPTTPDSTVLLHTSDTLMM